jgi:hypothetical protein
MVKNPVKDKEPIVWACLDWLHRETGAGDFGLHPAMGFLLSKINYLNMKKYLAVVLLAVLTIPAVASASWWNPFTWSRSTSNKTVNVETTGLATTTVRIDTKKIEETKVATSTSTKDLVSQKPKTILCNQACIDKRKENERIAKIKAEQSNVVSGNVPVLKTQPILSSTPDISPAVVAIDTFLANPTAENFKIFCSSSKNLQGIGEREVLNENRTDYVTKKATLYDNVGECAQALGEYKKPNGQLILIDWFTYNSSDLFALDNPNDTDNVRKAKINFNSYWKDISKYKLIGISYIPENGIYNLAKIKESVATDTKRQSTPYDTKVELSRFFIVPEQILSNIRARLVKN